jgi:16S rRNA (guanine527-N7)-methyltransferase
MADLLEDGLALLCFRDGEHQGLRRKEQIIPLLHKYIEEIELFNPAYGLVKVQDRRELIIKHILDSLAPLEIIHRFLEERREAGKTPSVADVGSGAGLPGIPLGACLSGADFTLIERMGRRAGFLRDALAVLGLSNVQVEETELEKTGPGRFDLAVFRAFRPLEPDTLKNLFRIISPNGILAAYKGRRSAIEEEMAGILTAAETGKGPALNGWEALPLAVPFLEEERHLVIMRANIYDSHYGTKRCPNPSPL